MAIDVVDHRLCGRSSSAAKKAEADFKMALARRSSKFSRSSCLIRSASSVVVPGRSPRSTSARRTQLRRVSGLTPQLVGHLLDRTLPLARLSSHIKHQTNRAVTQLLRILTRCWHSSHPPTDQSLHLSQAGSTLDLFASLDVARETVITDLRPPHTSDEFIRFLNKINREVPNDLDVHLVLDNLSTHKTPKVHRWPCHSKSDCS